MFYVISKQFIHGYSPMQIASSFDEARELIASLEKVPATAVHDNGDYNDDDTSNYVRLFSVDKPGRGRLNSEFYSVTRLYRS